MTDKALMTVNEVSRLAGVSIRTLRYYDKIGLLPASGHTDSGYRLYDALALERLQQILFFRELEFPLSEIKAILDSGNFDRKKALEQQIELLTLRREHLDSLISCAKGILLTGVNDMDFTAFDTAKIDEYTRRAKAQWGGSAEFAEFEKKDSVRTESERTDITVRFMGIFTRFGEIKTESPDCEKAQTLVGELKQFITDNFYECTDDMLRSLGRMYAGGSEFTENIDRAGGCGTADFVCRAIECFCSKNA